jgi:Bromodomain
MKEEPQLMDESSNNKWWSEEWLDGVMTGNLGDYPLICTVEQTFPEFPPDPYSKIVKTDGKNDSTMLYFKKPKLFVRDTQKAKIRLAVTLRPLTPLMAPTLLEIRSREASPLPPPPTFTVVTFPCELEPFIIPFAWGYANSHVLCLNQRLPISSDTEAEVTITGFASLRGGDTMRIDDRRIDMELMLSPNREELERALEKDGLVIPFRDGLTVLDIWYRRNAKSSFKKSGDSSSEQSDRFARLLRSTLPLWQSVTIMQNTNDCRKQRISPWLLVAFGEGHELLSPWTMRGSSFCLDESLRMKIEYALEAKILSDTSIQDMFFDQVTEELAPSYFCAVPVGMSFSTILKRVKVHDAHKSCYYRYIEAIIADVRSIYACCLLYNSPDSDVVDIADSVTNDVKNVIAAVTQDHYQLAKATRSKRNDSLPMVLSHCQPRPWFLNCGRKTGKGSAYRDWLDTKREVCQPTRLTNGDITISADLTQAPFQAGDFVMYSRELHCRFVNGHCSSLETDQCLVPCLKKVTEVDAVHQEGSRNSVNASANVPVDWVRGEVIWVHAAFPKMLESEAHGSFQSTIVLQCLGVKFQCVDNVSVLFWRPCAFSPGLPTSGPCCPVCGLSSSFIRFCDTDKCDDDASKQLNSDDSYMLSIARCINLLKRRCLRSMDPAGIDPMLTKENVQAGYKTPLAKVGKNSLPTYEKTLCSSLEQNGNGAVNSHHSTRGITIKPKKGTEDVALLVQAGFLPYWMTSVAVGTPDDLLKRCDDILPVPKQCLELIYLKLQNRFYRHKSAIENDIVEGYVSIVVTTLSDAATRKKAPVSIKRIAHCIAHGQNYSTDTSISDEEMLCLKQIHPMRSLYAAALLSVSGGVLAERIFGLFNSLPPKRIVDSAWEQDESRTSARQQLAYLTSIFGRDRCLNSFSSDEKEGSLPRPKLIIKFDQGPTLRKLKATLNGFCLRIKIVCGGGFFSFQDLKDSQQPPILKIKYTFQASRPLRFEPDDYERNDELSRLLFRRPGRAEACARCQAYRRSMVSCRVFRKHSNLDFNWMPLFSDGICFVDDLIKTLAPTETDMLGSVVIGNKSTPSVQETEVEQGKATTDIVERVENFEVDPRTFFEKADSTAALAVKVLEAAKHFSNTPLRLSKAFISHSFPIDKSDGHYLYCILCGLSGDLLCCDGCPNVVHSSCISLFDLPEGDWYCEECFDKKTSKSDKFTRSTVCRHGVYERVTFDDSKLDFLVSELEDIRNARPVLKAKATDIDEAAVDCDGDVVSVSDICGEYLHVSDSLTKEGPSQKQMNSTTIAVAAPRCDSNLPNRRKSFVAPPNNSNHEDKSATTEPPCTNSQVISHEIGIKVSDVELNLRRHHKRRLATITLSDTNALDSGKDSAPAIEVSANDRIELNSCGGTVMPTKKSAKKKVFRVDQSNNLQLRQSTRKRFRTARLVDHT